MAYTYLEFITVEPTGIKLLRSTGLEALSETFFTYPSKRYKSLLGGWA
jgi:hypothetical protein